MEKIMNQKEIRILKTGECPSLSGRSTLAYRIGSDNFDDIYLSLTGNTGQGLFNKDWVSLADFNQVLLMLKNPFTSGQLHGLFFGKSANCAGFFLWVAGLHVLPFLPSGRILPLPGPNMHPTPVQ